MFNNCRVLIFNPYSVMTLFTLLIKIWRFQCYGIVSKADIIQYFSFYFDTYVLLSKTSWKMASKYKLYKSGDNMQHCLTIIHYCTIILVFFTVCVHNTAVASLLTYQSLLSARMVVLAFWFKIFFIFCNSIKNFVRIWKKAWFTL